MAPIRRYLRITKFSVLEVRIYPEQPADAPWLLSTRDPVLPRVLDEVRPLVLPKLREENENARKKGGKKKKGIRDVAAGEDFEVVMFLTEGMARHSIVTRGRVAEEEGKGRLRSSGKGLAGWLNSGVGGEAITVEDDEEGERALGDIPEFGGGGGERRAGEEEEEGEALFVSSDDEETVRTQRSKRRKRTTGQQRARDSDGEGNVEAAEPVDEDDKKKLALKTSYDGFSIYGRILCLIVKRKGKKAASSAAAAPVAGGSQMMENWVSTQVAQEAGLQDDDEDG